MTVKQLRKELHSHIEFMEKSAKNNRELAMNEKSEFCRGLEIGWANAYETCIENLLEIIDGRNYE